jgi:hypothetical protein
MSYETTVDYTRDQTRLEMNLIEDDRKLGYFRVENKMKNEQIVAELNSFYNKSKDNCASFNTEITIDEFDNWIKLNFSLNNWIKYEMSYETTVDYTRDQTRLEMNLIEDNRKLGYLRVENKVTNEQILTELNSFYNKSKDNYASFNTEITIDEFDNWIKFNLNGRIKVYIYENMHIRITLL